MVDNYDGEASEYSTVHELPNYMKPEGITATHLEAELKANQWVLSMTILMEA